MSSPEVAGHGQLSAGAGAGAPSALDGHGQLAASSGVRSLTPWRFPSITRVTVSWLQQQFGLGGVGARRPSSAVLPYRMVTLVAGSESVNKVHRCGTVSVHTFAGSYDQAEAASDLTDQWMTQMGPPLFAPQQITYTLGDGTTETVEPKSICTTQIPIWADYQDDLIFRFVGRYEICVGLVGT